MTILVIVAAEAIFLGYVALVCWLFREYGRALDREAGR